MARDDTAPRSKRGGSQCATTRGALFSRRAYDARVSNVASPSSPEPRARVVEAFIDYSSPYAYLGSTQIERVAREQDARVVWRPFLLGALFREIGTPLVPIDAAPPAKRTYMRLDMERFAARYGVPFRFATRFPLRTVDALRLTLLAPEEKRSALVHAIFEATWAHDRDPASREVLVDAAARAGLDPALVDRTAEAKQALVDATSEAVARGVPGAPTFVVGDQLFWGQDRLHFVARALAGWRPRGDSLTFSP